MRYEQLYSAVKSKIDTDLAFHKQGVAEEHDTRRALEILKQSGAVIDAIPDRDSDLGRALMFLGEMIAEQPLCRASESIAAE
jgi:hypothetical protein